MACKISALGAVITAEIGQTETPVDKTKYGKWYGQDGQYWCDMFQAWCANQVGATDICGKFAYTPYHSEFFKKKGAWYRTPKKGDYAFFHNGERICHIGWVEKVIDSNTVQTIEGNTGSSSNANGGQVLRRKRSISGTPTWKIVGFGRPAYLDEAAGGPVNTNPQMQKYTVQPNDSLWKIAETYQVNFDDLIKANPDIHDPNILPVGKVINLPNARRPLNVPPQVHTHTVQQGEDFWKIAKTYQVNFDDLIKANPDIHDPNILQVGQVINLPNARGPLNVPPQVHTHTVQQGEDFWKIAEKYQVNFEDLIKANPDIHNPNNLRVGEVINLPNAAGGPDNTNPQMQKYTVQPGDSLWKIAEIYQVNLDEVRKANPDIHDPNNLQVGKIIKIPNTRVGGGPSPGGDNFKKVWEFFKDLGFSDEATAGIMGNLQQESEMNPRAIQRNRRTNKPDWDWPGRGLAQWETKYAKRSTRHSGRWDTLVKWAHSHDWDEWDLYTQLKFIWWELTEDDYIKKQVKNYVGNLDNFKKIKNIDNAVLKWERMYEIAGNPVLGDRKKYADAIYKRFARVRV
ncbi:phage tail tip lysozyme [Peribacillus sp. FSL R5-0717]|uniref:phage tail tip lysozyme n=1 Tax=Peribacillus sp. FSL R5-0717 TaxID=2975308 RepID=UPI0030F6E8B9